MLLKIADMSFSTMIALSIALHDKITTNHD